MPGKRCGKYLGGAKNKPDKTRGKEDERMSMAVMDESSSPLKIELILKLIFSNLDKKKDLLVARLVSKEWYAIATKEYLRGRTTFPILGTLIYRPLLCGDPRPEFVLDDGTISNFIEIMAPSPFIPIQQISLRIDPLHVEASALLQLLSFIAPWVKGLKIVFWPYLVLTSSSTLGDGVAGRALAWASGLDDLMGLQFPNLEILEMGEEVRVDPMYLHQTLAMSTTRLVKALVQGAVGLKTLMLKSPLFGEKAETTWTELGAVRIITKGLPPSLKRLGFASKCKVDYDTLTDVNLNLEELLGTGTPESTQGFLRFIDRQKGNLRCLAAANLNGLHGPDFPACPLVTNVRMMAKVSCTFDCLTAFPTLSTLEIKILRRPPFGSPHIVPTDLSVIRPHPSVRNLSVLENQCTPSHFPEPMISFRLLSHVFPNLTRMDFGCERQSQLTQLFSHLPHIQSLSLRLGMQLWHERELQKLESILTGIPPAICDLTKNFNISDESAFEAAVLMASRNETSTAGLANLKDLTVLEISATPSQFEILLTKLTFHTVFMKLRRLKELRLFGEPQATCHPIMQALREKGIHVRVLPKKEGNLINTHP